MQRLCILQPERSFRDEEMQSKRNASILPVNALQSLHRPSRCLVTQFEPINSGTVGPLCDFQICITGYPLNKGPTPQCPSRAMPARVRSRIRARIAAAAKLLLKVIQTTKK